MNSEDSYNERLVISKPVVTVGEQTDTAILISLSSPPAFRQPKLFY